MLDPRKWSKQHVMRWLQWASTEFSLTNVNFFKFDMDGQELCDQGKDNFLELAPDFVGEILWEHLDQMMKGKGVIIKTLAYLLVIFIGMYTALTNDVCLILGCHEKVELNVFGQAVQTVPNWMSKDNVGKSTDPINKFN